MLFVFPEVARVCGAACTLGAGCFFGAAAYACFPRSAAVHILGLACFMLSVALFNPSVPVVVGAFAGERHYGFASGMGAAARSLSGIISPLLAGRLYEHRGGPDQMVWGSGFFLL